MRYNSSLKLLEAIEDGICFPADLFEAMIRSGYGASERKIARVVYAIQAERGEKRRVREEYKERKRRYDSLIYKLKRDGLITEENSEEGKSYQLTEKGIQKLEILKSKDGFPSTDYKKEKSDKVIIAMFDIPEVWTRKRTWLRMVLGKLDFKMAQKSVWIGKTKIPKELITDLSRLELENYVEIFEVGKTGSLKAII